jgi:anti-sigma regulatory factor (Ser/Thr protein kinase)
MSGRTGTVPAVVRTPGRITEEREGSGAGPAVRPDEAGRGVPLPPGWSLRSCLELGALPSAVPCARLHTRQVLWEWGLEPLAKTAEMVVSEILTNAVNASATAAGGHRGERHEEGLPAVWFCLASDRRSVLVQVWDDSPGRPARQDEEMEAESGRGLLLVEHLSVQWGTYVPEDSSGKVVWAMCHSSP